MLSYHFVESNFRKEPKKSELLKKALGQVQHNGGKNLAEGECDTQRLVAWIADQPDPACEQERPMLKAHDSLRSRVTARVSGCSRL